MKNTPEEAQNPYYREVVNKVAGNHLEFSGKYWLMGAAALALEAYDAQEKRWVVVKILWRDNVGDMGWCESLRTSLSYLLKLRGNPVAIDSVYPEDEAINWVSTPELPFLVLESLSNPQQKTPSSPPLGPTSPVFPSINDMVYGGKPGWLPLWEILELSSQYAQFLEYLHKSGMAYHDLKLLHVYWSGYQLRVIDFNCCEPILSAGQTAPEQNQRDDIGQFGYRLLYPMLTGRDPYSQLPLDRLDLTPHTRSSMRYHVPAPLIFSDVDELIPQEVKQLVAKAVRQDFLSALDFDQAIQQCRQSLDLTGENPNPWQKLREAEAILRENREEGRRILDFLKRDWEAEEPRRLEARRLAVMSARER